MYQQGIVRGYLLARGVEPLKLEAAKLEAARLRDCGTAVFALVRLGTMSNEELSQVERDLRFLELQGFGIDVIVEEPKGSEGLAERVSQRMMAQGDRNTSLQGMVP